MQVSYHGENTELVSTHDVRLPKDSSVADVLEALRMQLPKDKRPAALRLLEVFYSKIYKVPSLLHSLPGTLEHTNCRHHARHCLCIYPWIYWKLACPAPWRL